MEIVTFFAELAGIVVCKELTDFFMPEGTGLCLAFICFTEFLDMVFSAVILKLTKASLKMFTDFSFHFQFLFLISEL